MSGYSTINGVIFCHNFINRGYCFGLGCKYLHVDKKTENQYQRTGQLPQEMADLWKDIQKKLSTIGKDYCMDQKKSKCFRTNCHLQHLVFRTDDNVSDIIEFTFRPEKTLMNYIKNIYGAPEPHWFNDVLCHKMTPFKLLFDHIGNTLKPFGLKKNNLIFHYNGKTINKEETPSSLDIGRDDDVYVEVHDSTFSLAKLTCAICLDDVDEACYVFPCNHIFDINCSLQWFFCSSRRSCPMCRQHVDELHMKINGRTLKSNYGRLMMLSGSELNRWTLENLNRPFLREQVEKLFNDASESEQKFNVDQLKICFKNMINRAKNAQSENKKETIKTGGGKNNCDVDHLDTKVLSVMGDSIKPLYNDVDSDAKYITISECTEIDKTMEINLEGEEKKPEVLVKHEWKIPKKRKMITRDETSIFIEKLELKKSFRAKVGQSTNRENKT